MRLIGIGTFGTPLPSRPLRLLLALSRLASPRDRTPYGRLVNCHDSLVLLTSVHPDEPPSPPVYQAHFLPSSLDTVMRISPDP